MDVPRWLQQKLDEPWSSVRLSAALTGDIIEAVSRIVLELDATTLSRVLLAILHLKPFQIRELQVYIDALVDKCESALVDAENDDHDWARFLVRSLKGFASGRRIEIDPNRDDIRDCLNEIIAGTDSMTIMPWMVPAEAKYLDASLLPEIAPAEAPHFVVLRPFQFVQGPVPEMEPTNPLPKRAENLMSPPTKASATASPAPLALPRPPPQRLPPRPNRTVQPFIRKTAIKTMGLEDAAQLQERSKRIRPVTDDVVTRRKEKQDVRKQERAEKEQKRIEKRDIKRRKKEDDKEAKRLEKELVKEQKSRALVISFSSIASTSSSRRSVADSCSMSSFAIQLEQQQQREKEMIEKAVREAAEAVVRQNAQNNLVTPAAHLLAQMQTGLFPHPMATPQQPQQQPIPAGVQMPDQHLPHPIPPQPQVAPATVVPDRNPFASMFIGANALGPTDRALIENFLAGQATSHPAAQNGILQVTMSENYTQDPNMDEYLEIVVFEMNFLAGSWRKLKRRKKMAMAQGQQLR